jgi:hypothetical protein
MRLLNEISKINTSFRNIGRRMGISAPTVLAWVNEAGRQCKNPIETSIELNPSWFGTLGLDEKPIKINCQKKTTFLAVDFGTKDLIHLALIDAEDERELEVFLFAIKDDLKYPCSFIVSDLGKGRVLLDLVERIFPHTPHQACVIHFMRYIDRTLPKSKKGKYYKQNNFLRDLIKKILFTLTFREAEDAIEELLKV